jgi:RND family efflux transporter MFP subunit
MPDQLSTDLSALRIDRSAKARSAPGRLRGVFLALIVIAGLGAAYVFGAPIVESKLFKTEVALTEIASVSPAQSSIELTSTGYVIPQSDSKVAPKIPGKVSKIFVKQGDAVKAGDVLFEIDPEDHHASIATAVSQASAARARAVAARAGLKEIELQAARAKSLAEKGVAPLSTAEDLEARVGALREQVAASDAEAKASNALVSALRVNLVSFTVRAPISGKIVNRPPEVGEFVGPQPAGVAVDMGGVEIADFDTLMVETDVPEQRLSQVKLGGPAEIVLDAYPAKRFRGKAVEITPKVNRAKATVTVKVAFVDDKDGALPEMSARVSFLTAELDKTAMQAPPKTIVPGNAVATVNGARVVYVFDDGKVRLVPVTLGPAFGSGFEILKGPPPGTRVVKEPPPQLADGQAVKERAAG